MFGSGPFQCQRNADSAARRDDRVRRIQGSVFFRWQFPRCLSNSLDRKFYSFFLSFGDLCLHVIKGASIQPFQILFEVAEFKSSFNNQDMGSHELPLSENQQRAMVASRLVDISFGTMWWLREWMWKEIVPPVLNYNLDSKKWGHPGVSILNGPIPLQSFVPMMHGRSHGSPKSVWIAGFEVDEPHRQTAFGHLIRPGLFPQLFLGHFPIEESVFRKEWIQMFGTDYSGSPTKRQMVFLVEHKPKATADECTQLYELLRRLKVI